jgi:TolA-binding protein
MEVLDAAYEKIRQIEAANTQLNAQLTDSNKEIRALRRERIELLNKAEFLMDDLENEKKRNQKLNSRHSATSSTDLRRGDGPPKSQGSHRERRESWREMPTPLFDRQPTAPRPPTNTAPNPFMPNLSRPPPAPVTYAAAAASYTTSPTYAPLATYTTGPVFPPRSPPVASGAYSMSPNVTDDAAPTTSTTDTVSSPIPPSDRYPDDGRYHPY